MLLTVSTTHHPATDLGYLLHKHPARVHTADLSFGKAYVFYPEATEERCTAALLVEVDPVDLVRRRRGPAGAEGALEQYVNDRPYVASSMLSVAIAEVFSTALNRRCAGKPELASTILPLQAHLSVLPCRGGESLLRRLFEPLGYKVSAEELPLDEKFPEWGPSRYFSVTLQGELCLADLLTHLYVLVPVLDNDKHYWVGEEEVNKLLAKGGAWLSAHPERELIVDRYLRHQAYLTRAALARLTEEDQPAAEEEPETAKEQLEEAVEKPLRLHEQRLDLVTTVLRGKGARRVLDLGCGSGKLLGRLLKESQFEEIVGVDVSTRSLEVAAERLHMDRMPEAQRNRVRLLQGALTYRDARLEGYDAAAVAEVIEHLDPPRLAAFERVLFEYARPGTVVITTPNREYNVLFPTMPAGDRRHPDHRFEWTRPEFETWGRQVAELFGYTVTFRPVGPEDPTHGAPTQMAVFDR